VPASTRCEIVDRIEGTSVMKPTTRAVVLPGDHDAVGRIDASFTTRRIYEVERSDLGFRLREQELTEELHKRYEVEPAPDGIVAELGGEVIGYGELSYSAWNRRGVVEHLYISAQHRGIGAGSALIDHMRDQARAMGARCLWLETQNVNMPAIGFYRSRGFRLSGLDESLYDPATVPPGEYAIFLSLDVTEG
jgi:ribosomal protein S18 acetylase RimI-like enzyme